MTTFYVDAKSGNDRNNGTEKSPFSNIQKAADMAQAGDTVFVKAGTYKPFEIKSSGTEDAPITFSAYPGQEHDVIIEGSGTSPRGLIMARGESHLTIEGFKIQNASTDGIFIEGSKQGEHGIQILNNVVDTTGNSGIYVSGQIMGQTIGVDEYRLFDVLIEGNEVTNTNFPSGGNEAISLGGGVDGFVIRDNWVYDSEQYGIDAKFGAINGEISGNLIHGIEKHAIYLDSNSRTIANIDIFDNEMFDNNNGIVIARESTRLPKEPNIYNIDIFDNIVQDNNKYGIMIYGHRADIGTGKLDDVQIFNNVVTDNGIHGFHLKGVDFAEAVVVAANDVSGNGRDYLNEIDATITDKLGIIDTTGLVGYDPNAQSGDVIGVSDEPKPQPEPKPEPEPEPEPKPEPKPEPQPEPKPEPKPESSPQEPADPTASDEGPVLVRMNAGGGAVGDWSSDAGYRIETSGDRNANTGAADDRLVEGLGIPANILETESFSNASDGLLSYSFDIEAGKEVELRLVFGEGYNALPDADGSGDPTGDRIFDVVIDDEIVFDDLDPYAVAGGFDQPFTLTHQMTSDGRIDLDLVKDGPENPQIRGIEIVAGGIGDPIGVSDMPKPEPEPEPQPELSPQEPADPTASDEGPVLVQMNAGGGEVGDWSSDAGYRNETSGDRNATNGAADDRLVEGLGIPAEVLETESFSNASDGLLSYSFDVEAGKEVELRLVFGEGYNALPDADGSGDPTGDRIFDVVIDDEFVFEDLDPYAVAGGFDQPFVLTHQMTSDGTIDIDLVEDGPENPQIRAIEIVEQDMFLF